MIVRGREGWMVGGTYRGKAMKERKKGGTERWADRRKNELMGVVWRVG